VTVPFDYDDDPDRYRAAMAGTAAHSAADLYPRVAELLDELGARLVLDVGCAEGVLRAALPASVQLVGLDRSAELLRAHPPPIVRADATALPFRSATFDAVTAINVLYHLADPVPALLAAHRVLRVAGHLVAATISREDSPELHRFWRRPATSFDAEDAADLLRRAFDVVAVYPWDAQLVTLPDGAAIRGYLLGRQAPIDVADAAARALPVPLRVTKRGALLVARRRRPAGRLQ
jgi:SAM-dependent methyltransferase